MCVTVVNCVCGKLLIFQVLLESVEKFQKVFVLRIGSGRHNIRKRQKEKDLEAYLQKRRE